MFRPRPRSPLEKKGYYPKKRVRERVIKQLLHIMFWLVAIERKGRSGREFTLCPMPARPRRALPACLQVRSRPNCVGGCGMRQ